MPGRKEKAVHPMRGEKWRMKNGDVVTILHWKNAPVYGRFYRVINILGKIEQMHEHNLVEQEGR